MWRVYCVQNVCRRILFITGLFNEESNNVSVALKLVKISAAEIYRVCRGGVLFGNAAWLCWWRRGVEQWRPVA
jgi:hypothetical protein